jgi:hypothetical protein
MINIIQAYKCSVQVAEGEKRRGRAAAVIWRGAAVIWRGRPLAGAAAVRMTRTWLWFIRRYQSHVRVIRATLCRTLPG